MPVLIAWSEPKPGNADEWQRAIEAGGFGLVPVLVVTDRVGQRHELRRAYVFEVGVGPGSGGTISDVTEEVRRLLQEAQLL